MKDRCNEFLSAQQQQPSNKVRASSFDEFDLNSLHEAVEIPIKAYM